MSQKIAVARGKKDTIKSDFNLDIEEKERRGSYEVIGSGKIGDGKHRVNISATNGNVVIKKKQ